MSKRESLPTRDCMLEAAGFTADNIVWSCSANAYPRTIFWRDALSTIVRTLRSGLRPQSRNAVDDSRDRGTPGMKDSSRLDELEFRVKLLERSLADTVARLGELTKALSAANLESAGTVRQTITIDADGVAPFASGFHARELDASGRAFRWTGGDDFFECRFFADRNIPWTFEMNLMPNSHVDLLTLRAFVDYAEVPIHIEMAGESVTGSLPVKPFSTLTTLTFYLPSCFVPSQLDPASVDHRSLGVVFYGLRLDPAGETADD